MVGFTEIANTLTKKQAIKFWTAYWEEAVPILGRLNIGSEHFFLLTRLKGVTLLFREEVANSLDRSSMLEFSNEGKTQFSLMGETTIEIGLAFGVNHVIYAGKALTVYRGKDDCLGKGELMVAVKHASGCWSHYPSPENAHIPLSDYKKAKSALKNFPISLRGELIHSQSNKLAKLLGLTVRENYAYLIK